jgi:hypothetical protein
VKVPTLTAQRKYGALCQAHPALEGLRTKRGACVQCNNERAKKWAKDNRERHREHGIRFRKANPEKSRAYTKAWRQKNLEYTREKAKEWNRANPERRRAIDRRRSERQIGRSTPGARKCSLKNVTPAWANHFFMAEAYRLAQLRTKMLGYPHHVDHIIPIRSKLVCGLHVENNLRVIPGSENMRKHNSYWPDMS